jgi:hypothetical protein
MWSEIAEEVIAEVVDVHEGNSPLRIGSEHIDRFGMGIPDHLVSQLIDVIGYRLHIGLHLCKRIRLATKVLLEIKCISPKCVRYESLEICGLIGFLIRLIEREIGEHLFRELDRAFLGRYSLRGSATDDFREP